MRAWRDTCQGPDYEIGGRPALSTPMRDDRPLNRPDRRHRPPAHRAPQRARRDAPATAHHVYGLHPVAAAFANPARRRRRLLATANAQRRLEAQGVTIDVEVEEIEASKLTRLLGPDAVHQGCLLYCDPLEEPTLEDIAEFRRLVVLD